MNELEIFLALAATHLIAVSSPGPDFIIVFRYSLRFGRVAGIAVAMGIASGILVHVFYSIVGLGVIIATNPLVFNLFKLAGACYLFYIAYLGLRSKSTNTLKNDNKSIAKEPQSLAQLYKVGFLTNALNIKATIFFLSVFLLLVNKSPLYLQIAYGIYMAAATGLYFSVFSWLIGGRMRLLLQKNIPLLEKIAALLLAIIALTLLLFAPNPQF